MSDANNITPSQLRDLVESAIRAPSSHNTQPWRFRIAGKQISLLADRTRALPVNDPDDRELTISCGCALMNLRIAAAHMGLNAMIQVMPGAENEDLLAVVDLEGDAPGDHDLGELFDFIPERRTYRGRFADQALPTGVLAALSNAVEQEGARLHVIRDGEQRQAVVDLVSQGDALLWDNPSWRRELAMWMHPRRRGDGLAVPGLIAPLARAVVRSFDMGNGVAIKDQRLAEASPVLAVLGSHRDTPAQWLATGQALQRLLLTACRYHMQASFLNQPIQVAALRPKLHQLIPHAGLPQLMLRLGVAEEASPPTPRRDLTRVIDEEHE